MKSHNKTGIIRPYSQKLTALSRLADLLVIGLTLLLIIQYNDISLKDVHTFWLPISFVSFMFFSELNELYRQVRGMPVSVEIKRILISWISGLFVFISIDQVYPIIDQVQRSNFWLWMIVTPMNIVLFHIIIRIGANFLRERGRNTRRVAIVGETILGYRLQDIFIDEEFMGLQFVGFFDDRDMMRQNGKGSRTSGIIGNLQQLVKKSKEGLIDIVYITLPMRSEKRIIKLVEELADSTVSVFFVPDLFVFDLLRARFYHIKEIPLISIYDTPFYGVDGITKRVFDVIISLIILIIIFIPLILIAISIKMTSTGTVLFKQKRYGFRGEEIIVWKFRSMSVSEDGKDIIQAKRNDPRITKLGAFLRRTSLDELPQFFNVLQGNMSIVGPRPHAVAHNELYRGKIKGYMLRHKVKPGITGLSQIKGYRGETDTLDKMEGRIKYDLEYIRNWTIWLDIKVIFITTIQEFFGSKLY